MGAHFLLPLAPSTSSPINPKLTAPSISINFLPSVKSSSTTVPRSRSDSDADILSDFELARDVYAIFGNRSRKKKRRSWWSDLYSNFSEHDEDYDDDIVDGFGLIEEPSVIDWLFKILQAFGWVVPAIIISMLQESDEQRFFMALAVPLGQTAVSLVVDSIWSRSGYRRNSKRRSKRRSFDRSMNKWKARYEEEDEAAYGRRNYQSWTDTNGSVSREDGSSGTSFGGWDELDK